MIEIKSYHINLNAIAYYEVHATSQSNDWILRINFLMPGYYIEIHYYDDEVFKDLKKLDTAFKEKTK